MTNFDEKYRPNDDLFRYANGIWLENTKIPDDKPRWGSFDELAQTALEIQRGLLENSQYASQLVLSTQYYNAYMNQEQVEKMGSSPIVEVLQQIQKLTSWNDFTAWLVANYSKLRLSPFNLGVYNDLDNPDYNTLHLEQGGLTLPDESYYHAQQHQEVRQQYISKLQQLLDLVGAGDANQLDNFCSQIAKFHWNIVKCRDTIATHNPMAFSQMVNTYQTLQLDQFYPITNATIVDIHQPDFFDNLQKLWVSSELDNWKNWTICHVVLKFTPYLSQEFVDKSFAISQLFSGISQQPPRWKTAVESTNWAAGDEIGQVYIDQHFNSQAQQQMRELVENLIKAYNISISNATWLSEATKVRALEKLNKFHAEIGFPQHWHDYDNLHLTNDLVTNIQLVNKFNHFKNLNKVGQEVDKLEWHMTPQTVNAYYNPPENVIVFPAGILQPPFFSPEANPVQNYGGIGAVIGHEIGHGFDDQGAKYNGDGELEDWWNDQDRQAFESLTTKLSQQFSQFTPQQLANLSTTNNFHVNGDLTTGENVGDVSGLKIALLAYALSRGFDSIDQLVDADKSTVQQFFIAFATIWRNKGRDEFVKLLLTIDPHSPAEFRANTVRNLDAFHKAFNTQPNDGLYLEPQDRVDIW